jgi:hypothetical protein
LHTTGGSSAAGGQQAVLFVWESVREDGVPRRGGFVGMFPVRAITYTGWHPGPFVDGRHVQIPAWVALDAGAGADHVSVRIRVDDGLAAGTGQVGPAPPPPGARRPVPTVAFLQLRGTAEIEGTVDGRPLMFGGRAAAETFVPIVPGR